MEALIFGIIGAVIALYIIKSKSSPSTYIPTRQDLEDRGRFEQEHEDMRIYHEYCFYRESLVRKIEEVNQYKDLDKDKWWYFFGIGMINIDWVEPASLILYNVYHEPSAKYAGGDIRKKMEAEYDKDHTPIAELPKMHIPSMI